MKFTLKDIKCIMPSLLTMIGVLTLTLIGILYYFK